MNMLQRLFSTFLLIFCLFAINLSYAQTVPGQMSYQGKLNDANGIPYTGSIDIRFVITATDTGGVQQQWSQTQTLSVVNGLYSATLGAVGNFIPTEIFTKNNPILSIFIDGVQLLPSISLLSVPYSFFAEHVGSLTDDMVETQHILNGTIKLEDLEADIVNQNTLLYMTPAGDLRWRDADEFVRTDQLITFQESTVANNGLTLAGKAVRLGGALIQNTNIDLAASSLTFTTTTGSILISPTGDFSLPLGVAVNNIVTFISATATDRQIPTAEAVADAITATTTGLVTATNGLASNANQVSLGGTLTTPLTTITTQSGSDLLIDGGGNFSVETEQVDITSTNQNLSINTNNGEIVIDASTKVNISSTNGTEVSAGTFGLIPQTGVTTTVNAIVTLIDDHNDNNLITEGAVFDFVNANISKAGSGMTQNGQNIDLGGALTMPTTISTQLGDDLLIDGGGNFIVATNQVDITSTNENLILNATNGKDVNITGDGSVNINANGNTSSSVSISSINGTQITGGTFSLTTTGGGADLTTVDEIVSVINGISNDQLVTENAIVDFVNTKINGLAGSGLTLNGTSIDLGGALNTDTNIDGMMTHRFEIQDITDLTLQANNVSIDATNNLNLSSTQTTQMTIGNQLNITAEGNSNLTTTSGTLTISQVGISGDEGDIEINSSNNINIDAANLTQIKTGVFGLNDGGSEITTVNEIVSVISGNSNDQLITEGAVFDFVNSNVSKAGSGMTQNGQDIDLGGALTGDAIIDGLGSQSFTVQNATTLALQAGGQIDIDAASLLDLTGESIAIEATGGNLSIDAASAVNIGNAAGDDINLNGIVQVETGTFGLPAGVAVNEILTAINSDNDDKLITEGAVLDYVAEEVSKAGSGMTQNGQDIDLGGALTNDATITTQAYTGDLLIDGDGNFDVNLSGGGSVLINGDGSTTIQSSAGSVDISAANGTQISAGTFSLTTTGGGADLTTVDEIVSLINGTSNEQLVTENAIVDFVNTKVNGLAGSGLTLNGQSIDLGGALTGDAIIDGGGNDFAVNNVADLELASSGEVDIDANDVTMNALGRIDLDANGGSGIGDVLINAGNSIDISTVNGTQISAGTFSLTTTGGGADLTTVDEIVSLINGTSNEQLVTENAIVDFVNTKVNGLAGSGLTLNGQSIDLGGALTGDAIIAANNHAFTIATASNIVLQASGVIVSSGTDVGITAVTDIGLAAGSDVGIDAGNNIVLQASGVIVSSGTDVGITAVTDIGLAAGSDVGIDAGNIFLNSNGGDILLASAGAGGTQIIAGTFSLPSGTSVNAIVTTIDGLNTEDDLVTEAAVIDLVGGLAGSGLNINTATLAIDLGGTLTTATTIDIVGHEFIIDDTGTAGFFGVDVDYIELFSETDLDLISNNGNIFIQATGTIELISTAGDIFALASGDIDLTSITGYISIQSPEDIYLASNHDILVDAANSIDLQAAGNSNFSLNTGNLTLESNFGDVFIGAVQTQITTGTFALSSGAAVNEIATVLQSGLNDNDNTLLTAKAIQDAIFDYATFPDNGLTYVNGSNIGLGGTLTLATSTIDFNTNDLILGLGDGRFGVDVDQVRIESINPLDLISSNDNVFVQGSGVIIEATTTNIDLISQTADIFLHTTSTQNIVLDAGQVIIEHNVAATSNIENSLTLNRTTTTAGGSTNGIGERILFQIEDNPSMMLQAASMEVSLINVTPGDNAELKLRSRRGGSLEDGLILDGGTNSVILGDGLVATDTKVGIGERNPQTTLHVVSDIVNQASGASNPNNHVMIIENINTASIVDHQNVNGLAINLNVTANDVVDDSNNFITFFVATGTAVGAIELTSGSGVVFSAAGADYAEWLERKEITENIDAADIVGIFGGQITKNTENAQQFRVVSTSPIVLGNRPSAENSKATHEKIAFLGQVPVKVKGAVQTGDYIIPSGKNDGVGIAVSAQNITASQFAQVIGMAWESSDKQNVKKINVAIGLDTPQKAIARLMENSKKQENLIQELQKELTALRNQNTAVKSDNVELKAQAEKMDKMQSQIDLMMQMMKSGQQKETLNAEDDK